MRNVQTKADSLTHLYFLRLGWSENIIFKSTVKFKALFLIFFVVPVSMTLSSQFMPYCMRLIISERKLNLIVYRVYNVQ